MICVLREYLVEKNACVYDNFLQMKRNRIQTNSQKTKRKHKAT